MKEFKLHLKGLNCANCANKIERKVLSLKEVESATLNFSTVVLTIELKEVSEKENVIKKVKDIVKSLEPDVIVEEYRKDNKKEKHHKHDSCCSGNNHTHGESCCGGHNHSHGETNACDCNRSCECSNDNNESKKTFNVIDNLPFIAGIIIYGIAIIIGKDNYGMILYLLSYFLIGGDIVYTAIKNIFNRELFDENFLMTIATVGAFIIGEYTEAVAVMVFYKIGEIFQDYAVNKSRKSIRSLVNIRADYANKLVNGIETKVSPEDVIIDDIIIVKPGERVPLDGVVIDGEGSLDTSALTGESLPIDINKGDEILSGSINLNSVLRVKVKKEFRESTVSRILELVENAGNKKAPTEKFITKFSKYYTPIVVMLAVALAIIPPLVMKGEVFSDWIYRAAVFLVVSCPCALVISIPLGLFAGIGAASSNGILIKGGNYLEALKNTEIVVLDKTGTLTKGVFKVVKINSSGIDKSNLLRIAAIGESFSNHPIAQSIVKEYNKDIDKSLVKDYKEISGNGIKATIEGKEVLLGNNKLMKQFNINCPINSEVGTVINVAIDGIYAGYILISDEIKEDSKDAIKALKENGVKKVVMLTGDNKKVADAVAKEVGVDIVFSELLPEGKVNKVEELLKEKSPKGKLVFIGDGINDAPVLARADIGIAMGGIGSDAAIEVSDIVLMKDKISSLNESIIIARKVNKILWQNIIFSLCIKIGVLILGALGMANIWEGVFADVGVTLLAVLNSMRALKK